MVTNRVLPRKAVQEVKLAKKVVKVGNCSGRTWIDPAQKNPKTFHHRGYGTFAVDGRVIKLKSKMR